MGIQPATISPVPIRTVRARLLLGWMSSDEAIELLTRECVPAFTLPDARARWQEFRDRSAALPAGRAVVCTPISLNAAEQAHSRHFMDFLNQYSGGNHQITGVIKVDLRNLIAIQNYVITERSDGYAQSKTTEESWLPEILPTSLPPAPISGQFYLGLPHNPHPMSSRAVIDVPHAEFAFLPAPNGGFQPTQFMRHVTVCENGGRILLKAGYHRSFARLVSAPTATVPTAVVALERNTWAVPVNQPPAGAGVATGTAGLNPLGLRPALFSDFLTEGLFIDVLLRRKRYQLHVQSTWTAVDDV